MPSGYYCPVCSRAFTTDRARQNHRVGRRPCPSDRQLRAHGWLQTARGAWYRPGTWRLLHPAPARAERRAG